MNGREVLKKLYGDGKPTMFVGNALVIALAADVIMDLIEWYLEIKKPPVELPRPDIAGMSDTWLKLYRSHHRIGLTGLGMFSDEQDVPEGALELCSFLAIAPNRSPDEVAGMSPELASEAHRLMLGMLVGVPFPPEQAVIDKCVEEEWSMVASEGDEIGELMATPEMYFAFRVWLPCYTIYKTYPPVLFHRARCGDLDAMSKLIRLDKSVIGDRLIGKRWAETMLGGDAKDRKVLQDAMSGKVKGKLSEKAMRSQLAGLISQVAKTLKCEVTQSEIRELFDRIAKARGKLVDTHLPDSPEAMQKAIQRNRNWPSLG